MHYGRQVHKEWYRVIGTLWRCDSQGHWACYGLCKPVNCLLESVDFQSLRELTTAKKATPLKGGASLKQSLREFCVVCKLSFRE